MRTPAGKPATVEVRKETTQETRPDGVTLRRTVIEEVVLPPGATPPQPKNEPTDADRT
jgi:hypothetical protein